jgi:carbamoyl-phosphate synthase large subunit
MAPSKTVTSFLEGKKVAQEFGFPLVIRASYTLGGAGAAFVKDPEDFDKLLKHGLQMSPIHEVMIDKALLGWKEYELELLRDKDDNVTIICSIENFDPMGIHTGDSITVAPAMTLSDRTYQRMRTEAIKMMRAIGDFAGGCNVQFAVSPDEHEHIYAIEINPRVSRSSALASKATGYPIAKIASKLAIGYRLDELENPITGTSAFFEPTLDYVIVKVPRWNFDKFEGSDRRLGVQMKSVGETMGIGRSFQEALQKACQSLEIKRNGLGADGKETTDVAVLLDSLANPSWNRLFHVYDAIKARHPLQEDPRAHASIDIWFLKQIEDMILTEKEVEKYTLETIPRDLLFEAKQKGYADRQVAHLLGCLESEVYKKRNELGIKRVYKLVDTCAGEFPAKTPYYYSTFEEENESVRSDRKKIVVLGSGPNRIGQGIEFDYSCVHGVLAAKETRLRDHHDQLQPGDREHGLRHRRQALLRAGVLGAHLRHHPARTARGRHRAARRADRAEARREAGEVRHQDHRHQLRRAGHGRGPRALLIAAARPQHPVPRLRCGQQCRGGIALSRTLGFPLLVRPSYVLGGQKMKIVINEDELVAQVLDILRLMPDNKILIDHFLDGAIEAESDSICDGEMVRIIGIMEHIEPGGHPQRRQQRRAPALRPQRKGDPADPRAHAQDRPRPEDRGPGEHPVRHQGRSGVRDRGQPARQPHRALHRQGLR